MPPFGPLLNINVKCGVFTFQGLSEFPTAFLELSELQDPSGEVEREFQPDEVFDGLWRVFYVFSGLAEDRVVVLYSR